jgi:PRTRC genetic system protein E
MFIEMLPLLRKRRLLLTISLVEGEIIRATVAPQKATEAEDNAIATSLAITGSAEELDREFPAAIVRGYYPGPCPSDKRTNPVIIR